MLKKSFPKYSKYLPPEYLDLKDYIIDLSDFIKLDVLGKGSYGTVWKAQHVSNGWIVAIKEFSFTAKTDAESVLNDEKKAFDEKDFLNEVRILSKFSNNPFFIQLIGFSYKSSYAIVTSFLPNGSLWDVLHPKMSEKSESEIESIQKLNDTQKTIIALGISYGMKYLHSQKIIHLDLKSPNILFDENLLPRIADFGLSRFFKHESNASFEVPSSKVNLSASALCKGTPMWMAPEQICGLRCGPPSDVFSFGIILYELFTENEPYSGLTDIQIFYKVLMSNERPKLNESESPLAKLIIRCWDSDPNKRPTFDEIFCMFRSGIVSFPRSEMRYVGEVIRMIDKHEEFNLDIIKSNASIINEVISIRRNRGTKIIENLFEFAKTGNVKEFDVHLSSFPQVDLNSPGEEGLTPIQAAIYCDQLPIVQYLARLPRCSGINFDINQRDKDGNSPFILAVKWNRPRIVAYLGQLRAVDVNLQNKSGFSALHMLAKMENVGAGENREECLRVMMMALAFADRLRTDLLDVDGKAALEENPELLSEFLRRQMENSQS